MSEEQSPPNRDALVALNRAATTARLMSGAVHEVNNALQVIAGSVELLEQQSELAPTVLKALDRIKRQSERAASALAELQVFTKAPLEGRERFNLREVVAQAIGLRRYAVARLGLTLEFATDQAGSDIALGNAGYVQQAVINLLVNAEQAMAGSQPQGRIVVAMRSESERVGVEVTDHGPGLSDAARARLCEPFATTRGTRDEVGLGLWASRAIAESFGGSLDVESRTTAADIPSGVSVVLWLPRS